MLVTAFISFDVDEIERNLGYMHHKELLKLINSIEVALNERIRRQILRFIYVIIIDINEYRFML